MLSPQLLALLRVGARIGATAALADHIEGHPDLTLAALQAWLLAAHGVWLSNGAMWSAVARLGLSFKKKTLCASEQDRPDVAARRRIWGAAQPFVDADKATVRPDMARGADWRFASSESLERRSRDAAPKNGERD